MNPVELIKKKRNGIEHTKEELQRLISLYISGELPEYQMSAWLMAVYFKGMTPNETAALTQIMKESGKFFDFSSLPQRVDKHSTGGVGDKTSLILGPIAAAAGVNVPMIAGRGLGHTGGTLDKLEALKGLNVRLTEEDFSAHVKKYGFAIMGQTENICPADRMLYSLRDVTATIESFPLICGSIMGKKLAEDLTGLVLDVKFGSGAFMKTLSDAEALASLLKHTGEENGLKVIALLTDMNQPMGRFIGNANETFECIQILQNETFKEGDHDYFSDTRELSIILAAHMIYLAEITKNVDEAMDLANEMLVSGKAFHVFESFCKRQGADSLMIDKVAQHRIAVLANSEGYVAEMDVESIGLASLELGAGRKKTSDVIDPYAGIEMNTRLGHKVSPGDTICYLSASDTGGLEEAAKMVEEAIKIEGELKKDFAEPQLVAKILD